MQIIFQVYILKHTDWRYRTVFFRKLFLFFFEDRKQLLQFYMSEFHNCNYDSTLCQVVIYCGMWSEKFFHCHGTRSSMFFILLRTKDDYQCIYTKIRCNSAPPIAISVTLT